MKINEITTPKIPPVPKDGTKVKPGSEFYVFKGGKWINKQTQQPAKGLEVVQAWAAYTNPQRKADPKQGVLSKIGQKIAGTHGQATRSDPTKSRAQKIAGTIGSAVGSAWGARKDKKIAKQKGQQQAAAAAAQKQADAEAAAAQKQAGAEAAAAQKQADIATVAAAAARKQAGKDKWDKMTTTQGATKARGGKVKGKVSQTQNAIRKRKARAQQKKQRDEIDSLG